MSSSGSVLPLIRERRDCLYLAFAAAVILRIVARSEASNDTRVLAALLLPLTVLIVARLAQRDIWHRMAGATLLGAALVETALGGSRAADALHDPLFWGVAAMAALVASAVTGRWPVVTATTSALAGAAATVAVVLPRVPDLESTLLVPTVDAASASVATLSSQLGVIATLLLFGCWLQAIVLEGAARIRSAERVTAAARGALFAGLTLTLAGAVTWDRFTPAWIVLLGVLLGLAEAKARTPSPAPGLSATWRRINPVYWTPIALLLLVEVLFSLLLLRAPGTGDVPSFWIAWSGTMVKNGLVEGYRLNNTDYPPLSAIMFLGFARAALGASSTIFLGVKVSLVLLLFITTYCVWWWTRDMVLTCLMASSLYISGVALGYVDLYYVPTMILSLWALQQRRLVLFSVFWVLTCQIKWQPIIIAPFLVLHALSIRSQSERSGPSLVRRWVEVVAPATAFVLLMLVIFGVGPVFRSLDRALQHTYLSGTALNFNWLVTYYLEVFRPDLYGGLRDGMVQLIHVDLQLPWVRLIRLAFVLFYLGALWRLFRRRESFGTALECALAGYLAYFMVNIGVHENHLFIATVLATAAPAFVPGTLARAVLINVMSNLNLMTFYGITGEPLGFSPIVGVDVSVIFAAVNVVLFLVFWREIVSGHTVDSPSSAAIPPSAESDGRHLANASPAGR